MDQFYRKFYFNAKPQKITRKTNILCKIKNDF